MPSPLSGNQMAAKYGLPSSDPTSTISSRDEYRGGAGPDPFAEETKSTRSKAMAWKNPQMGGATFMKFDSTPTMAQPTPGA
jgi:hypothetical protein